MKHLNIEHHSTPVYNTIYHRVMTMRVVDMKLRGRVDIYHIHIHIHIYHIHIIYVKGSIN